MNTGAFSGYLGRDAETRDAGDGTVTNFSVGVTVRRKKEKETLWVSCAMWGKRGQALEQYLTKGKAVAVSGEIDIRQYTAKDGEPRAELTCNVQQVTLLGGKSDHASDAPAEERKPAAKPLENDDAIPF